MKKQTRSRVQAVIYFAETNKIDLEIVSGEGEKGTIELYKGKKTATAIMQRLARERCNGDRWAIVQASGGWNIAQASGGWAIVQASVGYRGEDY